MGDACVPLNLPPEHLGLYVHVPFCVRKCRYCDFASQPLGGDPALADRYLDALASEAEQRRREIDRSLHSIFIGGGTPTTLSGTQLRRLWREVIAPFPRLPEAEITIEANPGTLTGDVLAALAELPLTRASLGVQSFHANELALLGRIHTPEEAVGGVAALRAAGIPQLNLDLMYALPGQSSARWAETLELALGLQPDHLSCYALIVEENTPLAAQVAAGILLVPGEEEEEAMAAMTAQSLAGAGFHQYEVSNAARPGAYCRHNLGYWLGRDYLGLGPAATSAIGALRWRNRVDAAGYAESLMRGAPAIAYVERLSAPERLLERTMLGLRLADGFDLAEAEAACGATLQETAGRELDALGAYGLLERNGRTLRLTERGYPLANQVVSRLMAATTSGARTCA